MEVQGARVTARVPVSVTKNLRSTEAATGGALNCDRRFQTVRPRSQTLGLAPQKYHGTQMASVTESSAPKPVNAGEQREAVAVKSTVRGKVRNEKQPVSKETSSGRPRRGQATSRKGEVLEGVLRDRRRQAEIREAHHLSFLQHRRELEEACQAYRAALNRRLEEEAEEAFSIGELTEEVEALEKEVFDESRAKSRFRENYRHMREHIDTELDTLELTLLREQHNKVFREWCYDGKLDVGKPVTVKDCGLPKRVEFDKLKVPDLLGRTGCESPYKGGLLLRKPRGMRRSSNSYVTPQNSESDLLPVYEKLIRTRDQRPLVIQHQQLEQKRNSSPRRSGSPRCQGESLPYDHARALKEMMQLLRPEAELQTKVVSSPTGLDLAGRLKESPESSNGLVSNLRGLWHAHQERTDTVVAQSDASVVASVDDDRLVGFIRDVMDRGENLPYPTPAEAGDSSLTPERRAAVELLLDVETGESDASLVKVFLALDKDGRGELTIAEFCRSMSIFMGVRCGYEPEWYRHLFRWLDSDRRGLIDLTMWMKLGCILRQIERTRRTSTLRSRKQGVKSATDVGSALDAILNKMHTGASKIAAIGAFRARARQSRRPGLAKSVAGSSSLVIKVARWGTNPDGNGDSGGAFRDPSAASGVAASGSVGDSCSGLTPRQECDAWQSDKRRLWSVPSTTDDPGPRAAHSCDVIDGSLYIFGGWNGKKALNDLFILDVATLHWNEVIMPRGSLIPAARNNVRLLSQISSWILQHTTAVVDGRLFIHGGHDGGKWLADTHVLINLDYPEHRLAGQQLQLRQRRESQRTDPQPPSSPQFQRAGSYPNGSPAVLFAQQQAGLHTSATLGGVTSTAGIRGSIGRASFPAPSSGGVHSYASPGPFGHPATLQQGTGDPGSTMSVGVGGPAQEPTVQGVGEEEEEDDELLLANTTAPAYRNLRWIKVLTSGQAPSARACHSLSRLNKKLFMFGGYDGQKCFNDIDVLDLETMTWIQPNICGQPPMARNAHTMTVVGTKLYLFGGHSGNKHLTDLHVFDTSKLLWYQPNILGTPPPGLRGHTANLIGRKVFLFGGYDGKGRSNDLYILDTGHPGSSPSTGDVSGSTVHRWIHPTESDHVPAGRQRHSACLVGSAKLFVFGGFDGVRWLNDLHVLDVTRLEETELSEGAVSALLSNLRGLLNNPEFSDVTLVVGDSGERIYAHKAILASQCSHFRAMFTGGMKESREREVKLTGWSYEAFSVMLEFLYTGRVAHHKLDTDSMAEVLGLADHYALDGLKHLCQAVLIHMVDVDNVCTLLKMSDQYQATDLKRHCMSFVLKNFDQVTALASFDQLSSVPSLLLEVTKAAALGHSK
ncbi:Kelch motif [Perkinsus chesapeaki]|uniref:Kelch motif n=1 Tax=Perkinsus chesapeaki TaxID=330153 RepID=A0A7J6LBB7_PERCH|nr:Kelch motif [Perkinsus chesapeaki]